MSKSRVRNRDFAGKILILDKNLTIAKLIEIVLLHAGFDVQSVFSDERSLLRYAEVESEQSKEKKIALEKVTLILCDSIERSSPEETVRMMRRLYPELASVLTFIENPPKRADSMLFDATLRKPFGTKQLVEAVVSANKVKPPLSPL